MNLTRAFGIRDKEVVSFAGGGGKTTSMFRLAAELAAQGKRVVTTTTTRIFTAQMQLAPQQVLIQSNSQAVHDVLAALRSIPHVLLIGATTEEGKASGIEPAFVNELIQLDEIDAILIEADGSRMRPFKAPAEHEPVIPSSTTLLVPIVGIDVVGQPLTSVHVHRPEIVSQLADVPMGTLIQAQQIARVLGDARGGLKGSPPHARVIPLINKVETAEQSTIARTIAGQLLQRTEIEAVAIGAVKNVRSPIAWRQSRISAVILAAGGSTRMQGKVKQLLPWKDTTLVGNAVNVAQHSQVSEIVVVTGNRAEQVETELGGRDVRIVHNSKWQTGRASSVRTGINALSKQSTGAIFINADQPFLTAKVIDSILQMFFETRAPIVVPTYAGTTTSPVLFARELFEELRALQGEQGGRDILQKYKDVLARIEIQEARVGMDLDTPAEYHQALESSDRPASS